MRTRLLLVALSILAVGSAEARIDVRTLTCAEAQALVRREGAIVLTTGRHTYERFVSDHRFCERDEVTRARRMSTRDGAECRIAYICRPRPDFLFRHF
jgi:hypothetical protein